MYRHYTPDVLITNISTLSNIRNIKNAGFFKRTGDFPLHYSFLYVIIAIQKTVYSVEQ